MRKFNCCTVVNRLVTVQNRSSHLVTTYFSHRNLKLDSILLLPTSNFLQKIKKPAAATYYVGLRLFLIIFFADVVVKNVKSIKKYKLSRKTNSRVQN